MTLRTILGLLPPAATVVDGEVRFRGKNILTSGTSRGYDQKVRGTGISMVFQEPAIALNPVMKVGRQITDAIAEHKGLSKRAAHELAIELMDRVGIANPERRVSDYPFQLSGGMRQRVMIAAALAQEPGDPSLRRTNDSIGCHDPGPGARPVSHDAAGEGPGSALRHP